MRRWRFDFAWREQMLAVEIEGSTWTRGRHTRGSGFAKDCGQHSEAALLRWWVMRFTADQVRDGYAANTVARWFEPDVDPN